MDNFILHLSNRLAAASEVLGQLAARDGRVRQIMELRLALERIACGEADPQGIAKLALGWEEHNGSQPRQ